MCSKSGLLLANMDAHGVGRYFPGNIMYLGEFYEGMPNGYGMLVYGDDNRYSLY